MDIDKIIMNKFLESFEKQTKPQLINQCNALFDVIWSDDKLKEKLLDKVKIDFGQLSEIVAKPKKENVEIVVEPKIEKKVEQEETEERKDLTPEQIKARKLLSEKRKSLAEKKKELEEKENIQINGFDNEDVMEESIKEVLETEFNEVVENDKVGVVEALPPLKEESKQTPIRNISNEKIDENFLMN